jgi:hypothetical protein
MVRRSAGVISQRVRRSEENPVLADVCRDHRQAGTRSHLSYPQVLRRSGRTYRSSAITLPLAASEPSGSDAQRLVASPKSSFFNERGGDVGGVLNIRSSCWLWRSDCRLSCGRDPGPAGPKGDTGVQGPAGPQGCPRCAWSAGAAGSSRSTRAAGYKGDSGQA